MDCFKSSDPAAVNATLVFDFHEDQGDLWSRSSPDVPLPLCSSSSSSSPPDSSCQVCVVDQVVYAVCRNLTDGVKMMMEAGEDQVQISKSDCPKPPSDDPPQWQLPDEITYTLIVFLLIFILGVICCIYWKCCRKSKSVEQT